MSMSIRQALTVGRSLTPAIGAGRGARHSVQHLSQLSLLAPHTLRGMRARRAARHGSFTSGAGISSPPVDPPHDIPDAPIPDSHEGHAFLHDFCMAIPYGMGMAVVGLVSLFFGAGSNGFLVAGLAAALLALTFLSVIQWRARRPSKVLTLAQAGLSFVLTWKFWSAVEGATGAKARLPNLLVAAVSAAMTAFLVYNVIAGGNPPKRTTEADDKALAQAAAES